MSTVDYSPEELAHMQERELALNPKVATEPKETTKKTNVVKDTSPSTTASVSNVKDVNAAPVDYKSLVNNVVAGYKDVKEKAPSVLESLDTSMPWLKYVVGTLGVLGAGAHMFKGGDGNPPNPPDDNNGGKRSASSIRDRSMIRIDPEMDISRRMPDGRIEPTMTNPGEPRMVGDLFPADVSTKELGKTPKDMPLVEASAANKAANETANELIAKGQPVKPTTAKPSTPIVPPTSTEGLTKGEQGMKNYLVKSQYGGGTHGEKAYEKTVEILGKRPSYAPGEGGGLSKEETNIIKDWRKENIEGPKVNLTKDMKRVLKGGGGIALLAAIPGFAEAAQQKNYGKMTDIASDFLVLPFAQSREAGMPKAQEESIIAQKFKEAQKLGSPYRAVPPPR